MCDDRRCRRAVRADDHSRSQRLPRRFRGRARARRRARCGGRRGAISPHQALGRLSVAGDRLLSAGSGRHARRCSACRHQSGQPGQSPEEAGLCGVASARTSRSSSTGSRTGRRAGASRSLLAANFPGERFRGEVHRIEHHLAHLSSAFHVSPFEEAVVVSVDGFGDFSSAAWGVGRGKTISIDGRVYFPHSLGIFYQALTQYLGFPHYGDEYKVMGLAPYGKPAFMDAMRKIVRLQARWGLRARSRLFSPSQGADLVSMGGRLARIRRSVRAGARGVAGTAPRAGRSARGSASRHRALGPGDVRRGLLSSDRPAARALRARRIWRSPAAAP